MFTRIRNYALYALGIGVFYFFITHHIAFTSVTTFHLLKKTEPTFKYTFISLSQINPNKVLRVENLFDAGLGELMVDTGYLTERQYTRIINRIEEEEEEEEEEESED